MISKEETKELLACVGSKDCLIRISSYSVDGYIQEIRQFKDSDKALKWLVDNVKSEHKIILHIA